MVFARKHSMHTDHNNSILSNMQCALQFPIITAKLRLRVCLVRASKQRNQSWKCTEMIQIFWIAWWSSQSSEPVFSQDPWFLIWTCEHQYNLFRSVCVWESQKRNTYSGLFAAYYTLLGNFNIEKCAVVQSKVVSIKYVFGNKRRKLAL